MEIIKNETCIVALTEDGDSRPIKTIMGNHREWGGECLVLNMKDLIAMYDVLFK